MIVRNLTVDAEWCTNFILLSIAEVVTLMDWSFLWATSQ